jgi:hypothetical protein
MHPAQLSWRAACAAEGMSPHSVWATGAVRALGAVVVGAEVNRLAAERAAVVDEFLEFLDGHVDWCSVMRGEKPRCCRGRVGWRR